MNYSIRLMSLKDKEEVLQMMKVFYESESLYEESVSEFAYQDYILMKKDKMLYEMEDAYMLFYGLEAIQFVKGSYVYSVGWDGTPYIRALHTVMGQD